MSGWTQDWTEEQKEFIERLRATDSMFSNIFSQDKNGMVIGYDERKELENLQARNRKILDKLVNHEFTVSVVGLENSGKSTLGNALTKNIMLPEYSERCTYTTTEIRYGSDDVAEVFFYTPAEFQKRFQAMLNAVKYEKEADYHALDRIAFEHFWEAMAEKDPGTYKLHDGKTAEDIKAILDGKNVIHQLLGNEARKFSSNESDKLQVYITGMAGRSKEGYAERTAHPYAVKNVIIRSPALRDMSEIVLYDVPGFDSATQLHKEQTIEKLKEADAIIFVVNAGDKPNLGDAQLSMLNKVDDEEGVKLNAKLFVFGNKLDMTKSKQVASDHYATLRNEVVNKYKLANEERVVCGSAKAYLEERKIFSRDDRDRGLTGADIKLKEWGMSDGVEVLINRLKNYYSNERYDILKQRAERTIGRTEEYLNEIVDKYSPEMLNKLDSAGEKYALLSGFALQRFVEQSYEIVSEHITQIMKDRPFSRLIEENIETIFPFIDENSDELKHINQGGRLVSNENFAGERVNSQLRECLKIEFMERLVKQTAERTQEEQRYIRQELVRTFLSVLGMRENCTYRDDLVDSANALFDQLLVEGGEECRFNSLVERFTTSLLEGVIRRPFGGVGRFNHVSLDISEFSSMAVYYKQGNDDVVKEIAPIQRKIFAQIIAHEQMNGLDISSVSSYENDPGTLATLTNFFQENKDLINSGANLALDLLPMGKWAKMFVKAGIRLNDTAQLGKWKDMLRDAAFQKEWTKKDEAVKRNYLESLIKKYCEKYGTKPIVKQPKTSSIKQSNDIPHVNEKTPLPEFLEVMKKIGEERAPQSIADRDAMLETLNTDIVILRDIMLHAVIWAIGLETAYTNVILKNAELIRTGVKEDEELMSEWLSQNVRKIKESEYASIINEQANNQARRMIVESIKNVLGNAKL